MQSQTTKYRSIQCHLDSLWEQFEAGEKSAKQLLKACGYMLRLPLDTGQDYRCAGIPFADIYLVHLRVAVLTFGVFTLSPF